MTTAFDRRCLIEFQAAAYILYERGLIMTTTGREYCPHCRRELCPSEGRIFAGICIDCFLADKAPACKRCGNPMTHEDIDGGTAFCRTCLDTPPEDAPERCIDCGAIITDTDEDGIVYQVCADCATSRAYAESGIPSENVGSGFNAFGIMVLLALLVALTTHTASAAPACTITGTSGEGFPVATCDDGSTWMQDMDGQIWENDAGAPVYAPGTWVPCTYC